MSLKKLPVEIQSFLNAASKIRCFNKAVEELVYNSLDANATSIAIRIDIHDSFIQVVDNGFGIPKSDMPLLGQRYTSSKITDASAFKSVPKNYGFHGESLSNIIEISKCVKITTRYTEQEDTWVKYFYNGQHKDSYTTQRRPSKGTTVEVKGFLYNLHIPKKTSNELNELEKIKSFLQKVALVKTNISFSMRDNYRNEIIFQIHKNRDIYQTLYSLFEIEEKDLQELQIEKNLYKAKGYIGKQIGESNSYRWMFLNGKFIYKSVLHDIVNLHFMPNKQLYNDIKEKNFTHKCNFKKHIRLNIIPTYFIFISCPYFDYDINFTPIKTNIEFSNWTQIELLLEKLVKFYKGDIKIKEIETEQPKKKRKLENTREEVKKIMEKVLGTKSKNQMLMHKVVKGKIMKTKLKNKVIDKLGTKIANILTSQNRVTEDNDFAYQKSPSRKTNHLSSCSNLQVQKFKTSKKNSQMEKKSINVIKKTMKNCTEKINKNSECRVNPGIGYHDKETNPTIKKNAVKNYEENIQTKSKPLVNLGIGFHVKEANSVIRNKKYRNHKNFNDSYRFDKIENSLEDNLFRKYGIKSNNKVKFRKPELDVSSNKHRQLAVYSNQNNLRPLQKVTNECLKSSDLVKTILNSQRGYSPCIGIDTIYYTRKHRPSESVRHLALSEEILAHASNIEFNVSTAFNTKLTYESHHYSNEVISKYYQSIKEMDKFIMEKFKDNPILQNKSKKSLNNVTTSARNTKQTLYKNMQYSKCDDLSQVIEFTNSYRTVNYFETFNNVTKFNKHQSTAAALNQCKITCSVQNTYTIKNTIPTIDIASFTNNINDKTRDEFDGATFLYHGDVISSVISKETENCGIQSSNMNKIDENNTEVIFISNSKNSTTHQLTEGLVPLNICEAVYQNTGNINNVDTNVDINENEAMNQIVNINKSSDLQKVNDGNLSQLIDKTENVSHHFRKINNNLNMNRNELTSHLSQGHQQNIKPSEMITNCINSETKSISNKFELQNRNHFVPKGMSPIFENCQTKNICSNNLEMDYFEDDLYHNFANDVLDNFKIFEKGVTNVNDIGPGNLNRHHVSLKFSAQSLKDAKVFGQVDKKFILAELRRDSLNTKHLVLFDQHAVHERIRLENNLSEYKNGEQWTSVNCEKLSLKLPKDIILYMNNFREKIEQFGLRWKIDNECVVTVSAIPKALIGKHCREPDIVLSSIKSLILEEIKAIKSHGGNILLYPKSIMDLIFSEACRYAIKFGDKLSKTECAMLISSLSNCKTPFQCAHGRPVMAVMLDLKNTSCAYKVDKSKIIKFGNKTMS